MIQQLAIIKEGKLAGRQMVLPDNPNQTWAIVERAVGTMQRACLIHEKFIGKACDECQAEEEKHHRGSRRQITEI